MTRTSARPTTVQLLPCAKCGHSVAAGAEDSELSAPLDLALMADWVVHATLRRMDELQHIAAIAVASGAALFFALMAWAGQHHS
jgi:hypothetical protein